MILARRRGRRGPVPVHLFDALHGTETGALIPGAALATGHRHDRFITAYHGTAPSLFRKLMSRWRSVALHPVERTAFLDIGAGKGRAMLLAAEMPFRRVVGVELHPGLAATARENLAIWEGANPCLKSGTWGTRRENLAIWDGEAPCLKGGTWGTRVGACRMPPMRLVEADAMGVRMPAGPCCVFLFNPFDLVLMDRFLDRLTRIFAQRPGELDLLYVNDEQRPLLLEEHPRFRELWRGRIHLSREDREADKQIIEYWADGLYVTSGYEDCSVWRLDG